MYKCDRAKIAGATASAAGGATCTGLGIACLLGWNPLGSTAVGLCILESASLASGGYGLTSAAVLGYEARQDQKRYQLASPLLAAQSLVATAPVQINMDPSVR